MVEVALPPTAFPPSVTPGPQPQDTPPPQPPKSGVLSPEQFTPPEEPKPAPKKELSATENVNDKVNLTGTSILNAGMDLAGLPGTMNKAGEEVRKADEGRERTEQQRKQEAIYDRDPMYQFSRGFHELVGKHWPTGDQIKDWFYKSSGVPRREPETPGERVYSEAVGGAATGVATKAGKAGTALAGLSSGTGEYLSQVFTDHPELARLVGNVGTTLGIPALVKVGRTARSAASSLNEARTPAGQEKIVGRSLAAAAGKEAPDLEKDIRAGMDEIVPGSRPTTAQAANSSNLSAAERAARAEPEVNLRFSEREAEQNTARHAEAQTIKGDPHDIGEHINRVRDEAKRKIDLIEKNTATDIEDRLGKLGPGATPEQAGAAIRGAAEDGYKKAQEELREAHKSVLNPGRGKEIGIDPDPAVRRINYMMRERFGPKARPPSSEVTDIIEAVQNDGKALSYRDTSDLISRAGNAVKLTRDKNEQAALIKIKEILLDRMDASASETAKVLPYKKLPPGTDKAGPGALTDQARLVRLNELRDMDNGQKPLAYWSASHEALEREIKRMETKVKSNFGIGGELEPDEWARYQHARELRTQIASRYERGAMGDVAAGGNTAEGYRLTDSQVPGRLFHAQPGTAREDIKQAVDALGGNENAMKSLEDYAVGNLKALAERKGGMTPELLSKWTADHNAALSQFPELKKQLSDIKNVQAKIADYRGNFDQQMDKFEKSAARHFLSRNGAEVEPDAAVQAAIRSKTATDDFRQLANHAKMDKSGDALAGLQAAVRDNFVKSASSKESVDGLSLLTDKGAREWLRANRDKVAPVMGKDHIDALQRISDDLARGSGSGSVKGPMTLAQILNSALGGYYQHIPSIPSAGVAKLVHKVLFGKSETAIRDLFNQALLDPKLAQTLLQKVDASTAPTLTQKLTRAFSSGETSRRATAAVAVRNMSANRPEPQQEE